MPSRWPTRAIEPRALPVSARTSKTIATARSRSLAGCAFRDPMTPTFPEVTSPEEPGAVQLPKDGGGGSMTMART